MALWYVIRYAERVKKDPSKSLVAGQDYSDLRGNVEDMEFTATRKLILGVFIATVILVVYGSLNWGWGTLDMAATYLICAMICAIIARYTPDKAADVMLDGASSMFVAAMVIGIARGPVRHHGCRSDHIYHRPRSGLYALRACLRRLRLSA